MVVGLGLAGVILVEDLALEGAEIPRSRDLKVHSRVPKEARVVRGLIKGHICLLLLKSGIKQGIGATGVALQVMITGGARQRKLSMHLSYLPT